jgi:hypothetical protein
MYFRTLDTIWTELQKAIAWFESIGISTHDTRIQAIGHYLFQQINFPDPGADIPTADHYSVINDASSFSLMATEFAKLPPHLLPKKALRDAIYGPLVPSQEDSKSNDSRNKFFELELAANMSQCGLKLVGFDDVHFEFEGCRFFVECKRPFVDRRFEDNLGKAYGQLGKRMKASNDRSLAAIAVEKVLAIDDTVQNIDTSEAAREFTASQLEPLKDRIVAYGTTKDVRTVGVLFIVRFLMYTKTAGTLGVNYFVVSLPFHYEGLDTIEGDRLLRLTDILHQKYKSRDEGFA